MREVCPHLTEVLLECHCNLIETDQTNNIGINIDIDEVLNA